MGISVNTLDYYDYDDDEYGEDCLWTEMRQSGAKSTIGGLGFPGLPLPVGKMAKSWCLILFMNIHLRFLTLIYIHESVVDKYFRKVLRGDAIEVTILDKIPAPNLKSLTIKS